MTTGSPLWGAGSKKGAGRSSHGSGATIFSDGECSLWGAIRDKTRSERCEG